MEYEVVVGAWGPMVRQVNEMIKQGWRPLGGIAVDTHGTFIQAMIKETSDDRKTV